MYSRHFLTTAGDRRERNEARQSVSVFNAEPNPQESCVLDAPAPHLSQQPLLNAHSTLNASVHAKRVLGDFDPYAQNAGNDGRESQSAHTSYRVVDEVFGDQTQAHATFLHPPHVHRLPPTRTELPRSTRLGGHQDMYRTMRLEREVEESLSVTDRICVTELVKSLPKCSGSDEKQLITFLRKVIPVFSIAPRAENEVVKLILPSTSDHLFAVWLSGIQTRQSWNDLHASILYKFFPGVHRKRLETEYVLRQQLPNESFSDFVEDIVGTAQALQLSWPEYYLVDIIMSNLAPHVRSHLVLQNRPLSINDVRCLASNVSASMAADNRYFSNFLQQPQNFSSVTRTNRNFGPQATTSFFSHPPPHVKQTQCFRCNGFGHIAKNCLNFRRKY